VAGLAVLTLAAGCEDLATVLLPWPKPFAFDAVQAWDFGRNLGEFPSQAELGTFVVGIPTEFSRAIANRGQAYKCKMLGGVSIEATLYLDTPDQPPSPKALIRAHSERSGRPLWNVVERLTDNSGRLDGLYAERQENDDSFYTEQGSYVLSGSAGGKGVSFVLTYYHYRSKSLASGQSQLPGRELQAIVRSIRLR
jgi:hypothetical protein